MVGPVLLGGTPGTLTSADVLGMLTVTAGSIAANPADAHNLAWSFDSGSEAFNYLADGESLTLTYTVRATDDSGVPLNTDDQTVTITITGSNDAPVLNTAATPVGVAVSEDAGAPTGAVGTLVSTLVDLNPPAGGLNNVTDADSGAVTGIAITGADAANGTWYFSTNGGSSWTALGAVSDGSARLLAADADNRLYFQPNANYDGDANITFRAWDSTTGTDGGTASTVVNGGSTAFSTATDTATFDVTPGNDAPVVDLNGPVTVGLNNSATFTEVAGPDTGANAVFFSAGGINISDVDSAALANLKVSLSAASATTGDRLVFGSTVVDITGTAATGTVTAGGTVFNYAIADASGIRTITFTSLSGITPTPAPQASYEALLDGLKYNNTSDTPNTTDRNFSVTVNDGTADSAAATFTVHVIAVSDDTTAPTATITGTSSKSGTVGTATFTVTFSESVTGVDASDFTLSGTAFDAAPFPSITSVTGSGTSYTVSVSYVSAPPSAATPGDRGNSLTLTLNPGTNVVDGAGNVAVTASGSVASLSPAGVAGEPINFALTDPSAGPSDLITVTVTGVPPGWTLNAGTDNGDGTWTVLTNDPGALTVTTMADFTGALVLGVNMTWANADGSVGNAYIANNVEAYAPGSPIFALSVDDNLTGSSGADMFVFAQPIGNNVIHSFDVAADKIDLIGFVGVGGFADLSITNDANGNAVVTIGSGQTITVLNTDAATLSAANFLFNVDPVTVNTGTIAISDGAIMPFGGSIVNSGTIALDSNGSESALEILFRGVTLSGGGHVVLSDNAQNVIFGGSADTVLNNVDNTISGAGRLGAGQMTLSNAGLILADGANALVIDTGLNRIVNTGMLQSTGMGGLAVMSALLSTGELWANGGDILVAGDASGGGHATISGATLHFGAASDLVVAFDPDAAGTLQLDASNHFSGSVSGFDAGDTLALGDVAFGGNVVRYTANDYGTGGTLMVSDGTHTANIDLVGPYTAAGLQANAEGTGSELSYEAAAVDHTMIGGTADDTLVGGGGNDTLEGNAGNDTLVGNDGNDILVGGAGDDILSGGAGTDTLTGGAGSDTFVFKAADTSVDTVTDFDAQAPASGGDVLNISDLLVDYTGVATDFVALREDGGNTVLSVDSNGATGGQEFHDVAVLQNVTGLNLDTLVTQGNIQTV